MQGRGSYQDVQTCCFEQSDLIGDGKRCEAGQLLSKLHRLYDALGGEFTELVPQVYVQGYTSFWAVSLEKAGNIFFFFF